MFLSGRGTFWIDDERGKAIVMTSEFLFFERGTVHALPEMLEEPVVFLAIDTPRRAPTDIIFVNPDNGTPATLTARNADNA